jgi:hypothetical protein
VSTLIKGNIFFLGLVLRGEGGVGAWASDIKFLLEIDSETFFGVLKSTFTSSSLDPEMCLRFLSPLVFLDNSSSVVKSTSEVAPRVRIFESLVFAFSYVSAKF